MEYRSLAVPSSGGSSPHDLADLYRSLAADGLLAGYEVSERFYEVGSPEGLAEMRELLSRQA